MEEEPKKDDAEKLELYRFVHSFLEVALKSEMTRKSQILDQSRTIQTVFSIVSVALFSVVQHLLHDERLSASGFRNEAEFFVEAHGAGKVQLRCLRPLHGIRFGALVAVLPRVVQNPRKQRRGDSSSSPAGRDFKADDRLDCSRPA